MHQCSAGHLQCGSCWQRTHNFAQGRSRNPTCGVCRVALPDVARCRLAEAAIAALDATCAYCGEIMTRGEMAAHVQLCTAHRLDALLSALVQAAPDYTSVFEPFLHALLETNEDGDRATAWLSHDPRRWRFMLASYRRHFEDNPQLKLLLETGWVRETNCKAAEQAGEPDVWPHIPQASSGEPAPELWPDADGHLVSHPARWPMQEEGVGFHQQGLLSQNPSLFESLKQMVADWVETRRQRVEQLGVEEAQERSQHAQAGMRRAQLQDAQAQQAQLVVAQEEQEERVQAQQAQVVAEARVRVRGGHHARRASSPPREALRELLHVVDPDEQPQVAPTLATVLPYLSLSLILTLALVLTLAQTVAQVQP